MVHPVESFVPRAVAPMDIFGDGCASCPGSAAGPELEARDGGRPSTLAAEAGLRRTSMREAIELAIADDSVTVPHAFRGAKSDDRPHSVRSVQRMQLPEDWTAERAAMDYVRWLPHFLRWMLRVRRQAGEGFSFDLIPLGITLLTLTHSAARSSADRQLFHVTGGALAPAGSHARFEMRQVLG